MYNKYKTFYNITSDTKILSYFQITMLYNAFSGTTGYIRAIYMHGRSSSNRYNSNIKAYCEKMIKYRDYCYYCMYSHNFVKNHNVFDIEDINFLRAVHNYYYKYFMKGIKNEKTKQILNEFTTYMSNHSIDTNSNILIDSQLKSKGLCYQNKYYKLYFKKYKKALKHRIKVKEKVMTYYNYMKENGFLLNNNNYFSNSNKSEFLAALDFSNLSSHDRFIIDNLSHNIVSGSDAIL